MAGSSPASTGGRGLEFVSGLSADRALSREFRDEAVESGADERGWALSKVGVGRTILPPHNSGSQMGGESSNEVPRAIGTQRVTKIACKIRMIISRAFSRRAACRNKDAQIRICGADGAAPCPCPHPLGRQGTPGQRPSFCSASFPVDSTVDNGLFLS